MKIIILSATTHDCSAIGDSFTKSALESLAKSAPGVPVTLNFDKNKVVGKVIGARVTDKGLEISASVSKDISGMFLVPGYKIPEYKSVAFGAVSKPLDETLPKIK